MSKSFKVALCVTLTILMVGAYFMVSAATTQQAGPSTKGVTFTNKQAIAYEGLRANFITTATPYAVLAAGFNIEDNVNWQCGSTGASTCSLVVNSFATSSGGGVSDDDRALCLVLDGYIVGACAYDGYDAADGSYSAINATNNVSGIPTGNHNSFVLFYTTYGTTMYTYTNVYSVFKP